MEAYSAASSNRPPCSRSCLAGPSSSTPRATCPVSTAAPPRASPISSDAYGHRLPRARRHLDRRLERRQDDQRPLRPEQLLGQPSAPASVRRRPQRDPRRRHDQHRRRLPERRHREHVEPDPGWDVRAGKRLPGRLPHRRWRAAVREQLDRVRRRPQPVKVISQQVFRFAASVSGQRHLPHHDPDRRELPRRWRSAASDHTWSIFGGLQPAVTIDQWDLPNITNPLARLRPTPADGTLVEGLPSGTYWTLTAGHGPRRPPTQPRPPSTIRR